MRPSEAFLKVANAMSAMRLKTRFGDRIEGLEAVPAIYRELSSDLKAQWDAAESQLELAADMQDQELIDEMAEKYCHKLLGLVHYATMRIRKREVDREIRELSYCAREDS